MSGAKDALRVAHTARCKLHIEADRPDRNLRFILGHAFTLDKMMLRIAEIEVDSGSSDDEDLPAFNQGVGVGGKDGVNNQNENGRRVSFSGKVKKGAGANVGGGMISRRSPPPPSKRAVPGLVDSESESESDDDDDANREKNGRDGVEDDSTDSDHDDDDEEEELPEDDESGGGLGLTRFSSAAGHVRGVGGDRDRDVKGEDKKATKPDAGFMTEEELREVCVGEGDAELKGLYDHVSGCPCHGEKGPEVQRFWEVPSSGGMGTEGNGMGGGGGRRVVVQVSA